MEDPARYRQDGAPRRHDVRSRARPPLAGPSLQTKASRRATPATERPQSPGSRPEKLGAITRHMSRRIIRPRHARGRSVARGGVVRRPAANDSGQLRENALPPLYRMAAPAFGKPRFARARAICDTRVSQSRRAAPATAPRWGATQTHCRTPITLQSQKVARPSHSNKSRGTDIMRQRVAAKWPASSDTIKHDRSMQSVPNRPCAQREPQTTGTPRSSSVQPGSPHLPLQRSSCHGCPPAPHRAIRAADASATHAGLNSTANRRSMRACIPLCRSPCLGRLVAKAGRRPRLDL